MLIIRMIIIITIIISGVELVVIISPVLSSSLSPSTLHQEQIKLLTQEMDAPLSLLVLEVLV